MKIALVTYYNEGKYPGEGELEDQRLLEFLIKKGLDAKYEIWTDENVSWEQYEAVILKSPWDYFDKIDAFRNWLSRMEARNIPLLNPNPIVHWNTDKRYLLDIKKAGFDIVPTQIADQGSEAILTQYFDLWQTDRIIMKPAISGGAKNTFIINLADLPEMEPQLSGLLKEDAYLIQPFLKEVQEEGEWSLIYFNGQFSHCILKVPKSGDFRVQHYFGGAIVPSTPPDLVKNYADNLIQQFAKGCLYARVDGLISGNAFKLMELEMIEPMLYLQQNEALYENYYQALLALISE